MKKILFVVLASSLILSSCSNDENNNTLTPITESEKNDLIFLREEEKLARDVYVYAYNKYQISIFNSITQSEQKHMDSVLSLLNKYNITDPATIKLGVFNNQDLQILYNNLKIQVDISSVEALKVGATIEDLDINDIDDFTINTTKPDLLNVYDNLLCGSKNHIRSFTTQLSSINVTYVPQFISFEEYNTILNSPNSECNN
jgi:hypothetical protein